MQWQEVTRMELIGSIICIKDAMIMLSNNEKTVTWPYVTCEPGEYVFEVFLQPGTRFAYRARFRAADSEPEIGNKVGSVEVDSAFIGIIDYEHFLNTVNSSYEDYEDWTAMELDDELVSNFCGKVEFNQASLLYVLSGDGDGTYDCHALVQNGKQVGIECIFEP
ncbi:MAG: hypothetical protein AB2551_04585 [Candidatus Thiodiazotropha sp.]